MNNGEEQSISNSERAFELTTETYTLNTSGSDSFWQNGYVAQNPGNGSVWNGSVRGQLISNILGSIGRIWVGTRAVNVTGGHTVLRNKQ